MPLRALTVFTEQQGQMIQSLVPSIHDVAHALRVTKDFGLGAAQGQPASFPHLVIFGWSGELWGHVTDFLRPSLREIGFVSPQLIQSYYPRCSVGK